MRIVTKFPQNMKVKICDGCILVLHLFMAENFPDKVKILPCHHSHPGDLKGVKLNLRRLTVETMVLLEIN